MVHFRDEYLAPIPEAERRDLILAYHAQLNSVDEETRTKAAKAWSKWEWACPPDLVWLNNNIDLNGSILRMSTSKLHVDSEHIARAEDDAFAK